MKVFGVILHFWLIDDLYVEPYGRGSLNNITGTPQYVSWLTSLLRPYVRDNVLELGAGIGNITARVMGKRSHYIASEKDPLYLHALRNRFLRTPNVSVQQLDPASPADFAPLRETVDTVLCLNVLEYVDDPGTTIRAIQETLQIGGVLLVLVPQGRGLFGSIDKTLGHKRRFQADELGTLLQQSGFEITRWIQLNKIGTPAWWLYGRVLKSRHINKITLKLFDKSVWFWRWIEPLLPWRGLTLIAVARRSR